MPGTDINACGEVGISTAGRAPRGWPAARRLLEARFFVVPRPFQRRNRPDP